MSTSILSSVISSVLVIEELKLPSGLNLSNGSSIPAKSCDRRQILVHSSKDLKEEYVFVVECVKSTSKAAVSP